jgi:hypothetical protein
MFAAEKCKRKTAGTGFGEEKEKKNYKWPQSSAELITSNVICFAFIKWGTSMLSIETEGRLVVKEECSSHLPIQ